MNEPDMPAPKFATARDLSRPTRGTRQAEFARVWLQQPFMPAQRFIADVAGELLPNGLPAYPLVVVTMQRRAGKTHLALARKAERSFTVPGYRSWYTAQTGGDARDGFLALGEQIKGSPLKHFCRVLIGNGREVARFANGSTIRPHPPNEKALHGKESDDNDIDEAWAFDVPTGMALTQAIGPTQLTRPGAQTWIWSAGGTAASTWLAELVARGRDREPGLAYFEWAIPDEADPEDLDVIEAHHPASGYTITRESLAALRTQFGDDAAGWARAAGNRWTEIIGGAIGSADWNDLGHAGEIPDTAEVAYGAARAADGSGVAVCAAGRLDGGLIVVELVDVLPTSYGSAEYVKWRADGDPIAVDPSGPSAALGRDLARLRTRRLMQLKTQEASAAVINLLDAVKPRAVRYRPHPELDASFKVAGTRPTSDGGRAWARVAAGASIAPSEAAGLAVWALTQRRNVGKPRIR